MILYIIIHYIIISSIRLVIYHNYGTSPSSMEKLTMNLPFFHSNVELPEGNMYMSNLHDTVHYTGKVWKVRRSS